MTILNDLDNEYGGALWFHHFKALFVWCVLSWRRINVDVSWDLSAILLFWMHFQGRGVNRLICNQIWTPTVMKFRACSRSFVVKNDTSWLGCENGLNKYAFRIASGNKRISNALLYSQTALIWNFSSLCHQHWKINCNTVFKGFQYSGYLDLIADKIKACTG